MESSYEIFDSAIRQALSKYWDNPNYDDMYQECYMKILDVLSNNTYDPVYNLYGYAYTIARNAISSFRYHQEKLTTLVEDDLTEVLNPESPSDMRDATIYLDEAVDKVFTRYKNILLPDYKKSKLYDILYDEDEPSSLLLTVVKGELIWELSHKGDWKRNRK